MDIDKNFQDSLAGLLVAALHQDTEDIKECAAYIAKRLDGFGVPDSADTLRRIVGLCNFIDGVWVPERWADDWFDLDEDEQLYTLYETERLVASRKTLSLPSILTSEQRALIEEILNVGKSRLQKLQPRSTCILTYGSAVQEPFDLALYFARQLDLECFVVEPCSVFEPRSGPWSGQLHWLCEFAAETPCVLVLRKLEEFCDTANVKDGWRVEELKCTRNKFLKDLSMLETPTVVVACTNFEMKLDPEVWEPFGYRMELNAAEPRPWLSVFRSAALDDMEGVRKALASLPAEYRGNPPPSTDSSN